MTYGSSGGTAPFILNLSNRRRRIIGFTPQPLYSFNRSPVPCVAPQQVWTEWRGEKSVLSRIQPRGLMIVMTKPYWQQVMYIAVNWLCLRCISWVYGLSDALTCLAGWSVTRVPEGVRLHHTDQGAACIYIYISQFVPVFFVCEA
jgi:hypothetical protein